jgi:DNA invertase Pin-like site-specific DNA recombinase
MTNIQITLTLTPANYRKLSAAATGRGINAHTLVEQLVAHALKGRPEIESRHVADKRYQSPRATGPKMPDAERVALFKRIAEMRAEGFGVYRIAADLGLDHSTVYRWLRAGKAQPSRNSGRVNEREGSK